MKITLTIGWKEVQQQIDLRNFYMGEAIKRREADGDIMQSCSDDKELLVSFANMACNGLITAAALRSHIINFGIDNNNITIMFEADDDIFLSSKIVSYLPINKPILAVSGKNSPVRGIMSGLYSIQHCYNQKEDAYRAMKACVSAIGKGIDDRKSRLYEFDADTVAKKIYCVIN